MGASESTTPVTFHDAAGVRTIDVGLDGPQGKGHVARHVDEQRGEDLRLAYVALTRACHQAVVWWAGSWQSKDSALSRLLFDRGLCHDGCLLDRGVDRRSLTGGRGGGGGSRGATGPRGQDLVHRGPVGGGSGGRRALDQRLGHVEDTGCSSEEFAHEW